MGVISEASFACPGHCRIGVSIGRGNVAAEQQSGGHGEQGEDGVAGREVGGQPRRGELVGPGVGDLGSLCSALREAHAGLEPGDVTQRAEVAGGIDHRGVRADRTTARNQSVGGLDGLLRLSDGIRPSVGDQAQRGGLVQLVHQFVRLGRVAQHARPQLLGHRRGLLEGLRVLIARGGVCHREYS